MALLARHFRLGRSVVLDQHKPNTQQCRASAVALTGFLQGKCQIESETYIIDYNLCNLNC